jgi:hypothetical protein
VKLCKIVNNTFKKYMYPMGIHFSIPLNLGIVIPVNQISLMVQKIMLCMFICSQLVGESMGLSQSANFPNCFALL